MGLEGVVHTKNFDSHSNETRTIISLLSSPPEENLELKQVRVVLIKKEEELGNHWREYGERYGVIGFARFTLEDIDNKKQVHYDMETGDILYIPPRIALKVHAKRGTVLVGLSESHGRETGTHSYKVS